VGLVDLELTDRTPFGIEECAKLPLFTPQLIELMRRVIPPERQSCVATSVIVRARKPEAGRRGGLRPRRRIDEVIASHLSSK
jgi:hypothetical protein